LSLKDKLFSNLGWKIVAILLALVLWFHVATEKTYEKIFVSKIDSIGLYRNLEIEKLEPGSTRVSVVGTGKQLLQLMFSGGITAYVDLAGISRPGRYEFNLGLSNLYDIESSSFRNITFISENHVVVYIKAKT
jgi:YbbR domain-containing protein